MELIIALCVIVVVLFAVAAGLLSRYRKCPSDKVLVIYGKVGTDRDGQARSAKCIHGGAAFIVPVIDFYQCGFEKRAVQAKYPRGCAVAVHCWDFHRTRNYAERRRTAVGLKAR